PVQDGFGLVRLDDHVLEQVRQAVVRRQLDPLGSTRMRRTSSGWARISRLVIRALTQTLLPEPVAPAMSRCGILARSTAIERPDTSRPRAKVSGLVDRSMFVSSTSGRKPTISLI